jgi:succinate dehydrogenase / fumarate reductase iron-sulfur subunit
MSDRDFKVWRGNSEGGSFVDFKVPVDAGMVVLDALHRIQAREASDLAVPAVSRSTANRAWRA